MPIEGLGMRLPRMTTRRWMAVVAALAFVLGALLEANRLRRKRDVLLARAGWHGAAETQFRALVRSAASRPVRSTNAAQVLELAPETSADPVSPIDRWARLTKWDPARAETVERLREARAIDDAMADKASKIVADHARRQAVYHQKRATYHAALRRKYEAAAARPWLSVPPDPPTPN
jgi:hypothetical protein